MLAGGTGGAMLASGFQAMVSAGDLTVIANTADDDEFWGLLVCPDLDAVVYRLAGAFNDAAGYGLKDDTFRTLEALEQLGRLVAKRRWTGGRSDVDPIADDDGVRQAAGAG